MSPVLAQLSTDNILQIAGLATTIIGGVAVVVKLMFKGAIAPLSTKIAAHDQEIADIKSTANRAVELGSSTNIKVARIEGFLSANGSGKLPAVAPTVEKADTNGQITEEPLIPPTD